MMQPIVPAITTNRTRARRAHNTTSTAFSRPRACSQACDGTARELALKDYGQIFFGFLPMLKVLGSAEVNSITAGLNDAHWPYASHLIGPLSPSNWLA